MIFTDFDGYMRFYFRDPEARARYVFEAINGLTWPCEKTEAEKRRLMKAFDDGWSTSSLGFLASLPLSEVDAYRDRLSAFSNVQG